MKTELTMRIERPAAEVFEAVDEHLAEWSITCVEDEVLERTPEVVGSTFRVYRGAALQGPAQRPDQVLKSSGNVLYFALRDVLGDERPPHY